MSKINAEEVVYRIVGHITTPDDQDWSFVELVRALEKVRAASSVVNGAYNWGGVRTAKAMDALHEALAEVDRIEKGEQP